MNADDLKTGITDAVPDSLHDGLDKASDAVGGAAQAAGSAARRPPVAAILAGAVLAALAVLMWRRLG